MKNGKLIKELSRFKRYRDNLINADSDDIEHHLRDFATEVGRNQLVASVRASLPPFDAEAWWAEQVGTPTNRPRGGIVITFPADESDRLQALLGLMESMAAKDPQMITLRQFGYLLGHRKMVDIASVAIKLVFRPLADLLTEHLREQAEIANPAIRELAGVPLNQIPADNETKIFLSHKSSDKELVRPYYNLLKELGFDPWLDEADMKAGDTLHREIAHGFDRSCAVVFFVTENFKDEKWLGHEVNHAVLREIDRGERFVIVTLVFNGAEVPKPLCGKLYKEVENDIVGVHEIIRALPVIAGPLRWRT